ncbi:hypothetical protein ILUMI_15644 [Ignelater luminosus]|uniref:Cytochrome P450 n=1 Tax=Ignelater luminosus TaxID=2038154 RepID=A0A8K0CN73_IGNLU|nr:hypothetical protein ILUMI_15644 [Ignelater luminosus]
MLMLLLIGVLSVLFYFKVIKVNKYWEEKGVPYIKPLPIFGNMISNVFQRKSFTDLVHDMYKAYPNERYVGIFQFTTPTLLVRDLELLKKITVKDFDVFPDHRMFASSASDPIASKNLFNLKAGNGWQDMRATLSPAFTSSKMRAMFVLMDECADQFIKHFKKQNGVIPLELKDTFTRFTNDVIGTTAFGVTCDSLKDRNNDFYEMGKELTAFRGLQLLKFVGFIFSPTLMGLLNIKIFSERVTDFFKSLVNQTLKIRTEQGIVRPDMIHLLMEAKNGRLKFENQNNVIDTGFAVVEESELGKTKRQRMEITDDDITAQALIFFFAGFDAGSSLMCYICYELARNPDIQEKLYREIIEACNKKMTYEAVLGMKYLDCVVSETLRKWPLGPFLDRVSVKPFTIEPERPGEKPLHLEAGSTIWVPVMGIHRDPNHYPDPEKFDPERFNDENKKNIKPFSYLPFGTGPRNCIGSRFALLESKLIVVRILQDFEIVPVDKTPDRIIFSASNLNPLPDGGFWVGFKQRST